MKVCICSTMQYIQAGRYATQWGPIDIGTCPVCSLARDVRNYVNEGFYQGEGAYRLPSGKEFSDLVVKSTRYIKFISQFIKSKGKSLDIGCNAGYLVEALKNAGWEASGVELNPLYIQFATARGLDVTQGSTEKLPFAAESFDLISLCHVLEHLSEPNQTLEQAFRLLKPGGFLLVAVPNFKVSKLHKFFLGDRECIFLPGQHIWYFSKDTLDSTVSRLGFQPVKTMTYIALEGDSKKIYVRGAKHLLQKWVKFFDRGPEIFALFVKTQISE